MEKNKLLGGVAVLALVLLVIGVFNLSSSVSSAIRIVAEKLNIPLGAVPGPSISGNFYSIGGVEKYSASTWTATSSIVCSFRNPWSNKAGTGTSTIDRITVKFPGGYAGAFNYSISTSTTALSSSTIALLPEKAVSATALDYTIWTPRIASSTSEALVPAPNTLFWYTFGKTSPFYLDGGEYLNVRIASTTPGVGVISGGNCNFESTKL